MSESEKLTLLKYCKTLKKNIVLNIYTFLVWALPEIRNWFWQTKYAKNLQFLLNFFTLSVWTPIWNYFLILEYPIKLAQITPSGLPPPCDELWSFGNHVLFEICYTWGPPHEKRKHKVSSQIVTSVVFGIVLNFCVSASMTLLNCPTVKTLIRVL